MKKKITVLGAGLVGSAMVKDLSRDGDIEVLATDINPTSLLPLSNLPHVSTKTVDVTKAEQLSDALEDCDLVICAVPGFMGYHTLESILNLGKNVVDISFFPEDAFELDHLAKSQGAIAVVDCGVAPGLSNIQAGWAAREMDSVDSYLCYVGGLPQTRKWPFEYKAVFSPIDVIEEYTRPARFVEHGNVVVKEALSGIEKMDLPGVGTVEAFNSDGLRTLIHTLDAPFKKEMTLRYPGHAELMRVFREMGLFSYEPIEVREQQVRPIDLTSKLLFDEWAMKNGETDLTVMQVIMEGTKDGSSVRYTFDLLDYFDSENNVHSMARTTGYTCTLIARMVLSGEFDRTGISPPEYVGGHGNCYQSLLEGYESRGIHVSMSKE